MSGTIRLLSEEVIGKIAAGEVVERPAAAIKELVENSLDAGATAVTVEIREGGITYFRVTDNGSGIRQSDIRMAFERHATSKITSSADLNAIGTLGFRGEALASIAAVARVTCTTRTRDDVSGLKVLNEGGVIRSIEEAACPQGTSFVVRDLFYNQPVRLRFLKKPAIEAGMVSDLVMRLILSRPDVSFRYISQGKTLYHSAGDGKLESAVFAIYGHEMLRNMRRIDGNENGLVVTGYVGIGESGRSNRSNQSFFINGRYMRSGLLSAAVEEACRERVMIGKYPTCVLHITMPLESVDVNVHPNKLEVRFQNEQGVGEAVMDIVRRGLADRDALERPTQMKLTPDAPTRTPVAVGVKMDGIPIATIQARSAATVPAQVTPTGPEASRAPIMPAVSDVKPFRPEDLPESQLTRREGPSVLREAAPDLNGYISGPTPVSSVPVPPPVYNVSPLKHEQPSFLPDAPKPLRMIGTLFDTYVLIEYEGHLLMIDQHAVHERLLFDRWMKLYDTQRAGQELLVPLICPVNRREQMLLEENRAVLERIGFVIESFSATEVAIRTIPMLMGEPQTADFLQDLLAQLGSERGMVTLEKRRTAILQTACKHAVKGGEKLTDDELRSLVTQMIDQKVTPTCPHGRPLVISLSRDELDKRFRRIQ